MTYHMEQTRMYGNRPFIQESSGGRVKLENMVYPPNMVAPPEKRIPFPLRLWDAVNKNDADGPGVLRWTDDGRAFTVDEDRFENEVMWRYPGLMLIPSFANFRRQLRVYNFEWTVVDGNRLVFFHPSFVRGRPEAVQHINTKRKNSTQKKLQQEEESMKISEQPETVEEDTPADGTENGENDTPENQQGAKKRRYKKKKGPASRETAKPLEHFPLDPQASQVEIPAIASMDNIVMTSNIVVPVSGARTDPSHPTLVTPCNVINQPNWNYKYQTEVPMVNGYMKRYPNEEVVGPQVYAAARPVLQSYGNQCMHHCCYKCGISWYSPPPPPPAPIQTEAYYTLPSYYKTNAGYPIHYYQETPAIYTANYIAEEQQAAQVAQGSEAPIVAQQVEHKEAPQQAYYAIATDQQATEVQGEVTVATAEVNSVGNPGVGIPMESVTNVSAYQVATVNPRNSEHGAIETQQVVETHNSSFDSGSQQLYNKMIPPVSPQNVVAYRANFGQASGNMASVSYSNVASTPQTIASYNNGEYPVTGERREPVREDTEEEEVEEEVDGEEGEDDSSSIGSSVSYQNLNICTSSSSEKVEYYPQQGVNTTTATNSEVAGETTYAVL